MGVVSVVWMPLIVTVITGTQQPQPCLRGEVRHISISSQSDDDYKRVKWDTRACKGTMEIYGNVRIAGDLSGFEFIPQDGKVVITSTDDDHDRELTLTHAPQGFAYVYEVDGKRATWDNAGKAWLSSIIQLLVRRAGYGADERVDYLLKSGGPNAVLQEVRLIDSDYTQRIYLTKLLNRTTLNATAVESVIKSAGETLESDYELASFLITVANKYEFTAGARLAFIAATQSLDSDYEHKRTLTAVLKKGNLNADDLTAVLHSVREIDSDYERGQVLKAVAPSIDFSQPQLQEAYVKAASEIDSDHELRQVLSAVLKRDRVSVAALDAVLTAAATLGSDYERAELLMQILRNYTLTREQRNQVIKITDQMGSDHERGRVSSMLLRQMNAQQ
jgi:hypothetical protein